MQIKVFPGLVIFALASCAASSVEPLSIPLVYKAEPRQVLQAFACPATVQVRVEDARAEKLLGERLLEGKPLKADVSTGSDPASWVRGGIENYVSRSGIQLAPGPELDIQLQGLRTSETVWHRSGYDARIAIEARLTSKSGSSCWQSSITGKSGNYGYSGSVENYQETLNGALDDAASRIVESAGFQNALCQCS
jgi:hypothetical protein